MNATAVQAVCSERGFLLDISRCKVPTMEALFGLIDLLAGLNYNQFYLYIEHTFAYRNHEEVWRDASPLTAGEIRCLDEYCEDRSIELVPVQNSLGHMERWLKHPAYKKYAECPDGFYYEPFKKQYEYGTTLAPTDETLKFLDQLYDEYLSNFRSDKLVTGCDEPWELGLGRSKERVAKEGYAAVYSDWLRKLDELSRKYGRRMLYFADVIQEHPELLGHLPPDASPIVWGYYPGRIPEADCAQIAATGTDFYIAPGVNCWLSFAGRLDYVVHNTREAAELGKKYGARGIINTSWGDDGNHYAWSAMYPGILLGAGVSADRLAEALDEIVFKNASPGLGEALLELAAADHIHLIDGWPDGFPHHLSFRGFFGTNKELHQFFDGKVSIEEAQRTLSRFLAVHEKLAALTPGNEKGEITREELLLAADMAILGCRRALHHLLGKNVSLREEYEEIAGRFSRVWTLRARPGGLSESLAKIKSVEHS